MRNSKRYTFVVTMLAGLSAGVVSAQAACFTGIAPVSPEAVSSFTGNPDALLTRYPQGGSNLVGDIRNLVLASPASLPSVMGLVGSATGVQKSSIAAGLAQAARACQALDPTFVQQIQQAVVALNDREFQTAFLSISGDSRTAAISGAAATGGGPGGAFGGGGGGGALGSQQGSTGVPNSGGNLFSGGGGSARSFDRNNAALFSVSP